MNATTKPTGLQGNLPRECSPQRARGIVLVEPLNGAERDGRSCKERVERLLENSSNAASAIKDARRLASAGESVLGSLISILRNGDEAQRERAAWLLGELGDASAGGALSLALDDPCRNVQINARFALGKIESGVSA